MNSKFVDIGKKLLPEARWICGSVFDKSIWDGLKKERKNKKYNLCISNPPIGKSGNNLQGPEWMKYPKGEMELMVLELALLYANHASFVMSANSVEFITKPYYQRVQSRKVDTFLKSVNQFFFMEYMSIDSDVYKDNRKT